MIRLGLCCLFLEEPIKFRTTTAAYCNRIENPKEHIHTLILDNCDALLKAIEFCAEKGIGCFRINSRFCPLATHPDHRYSIQKLPPSILTKMAECKAAAKRLDMRLVFHPDQFVVINSENPEVVKSSLKELEYHAELSDLLGADVINIHAGGVYGDKEVALKRLQKNLARCSDSLREKLTLENDDKNYTVMDLLPLCRAEKIPLVFDSHHHRCLDGDAFTVQGATEEALRTWDREPLVHISSPLEGYRGRKPERHHDYIQPEDFPEYWATLPRLTVEVEAKAKELAVLRLRKTLENRGISLWQSPGTSPEK